MANEPLLTVVGNLTADPVLKYVGQGNPVANFTVACTPRNQVEGQWVDGDPMFFNCAAWNEYAENVTESLSRGDRVSVTGRFTVRKFVRNDGTDGQSLDIRVDEVGPSLRFATAQVTRTASRSSQAGQGYSQPVSSRPVGDQPLNTGNRDPWATQSGAPF